MQGSGVPVGTIIPYYGDLSKIPSNFKYCDGTNGTPDLRGRVIVETGPFNDSYGSIIYNLGDIGGERLHHLTVTEMPAHRHYGDSPFNEAGFDASGADTGAGTSGWPIRLAVGDNPPYGGYEVPFMTAPTGGDQPHNIMQPYMAIHYIMRIK